MELLRNLSLTVVSLVVGFLVLEVGVRSYDAASGRGFFSDHRNLLAAVPKLRPFRTFGPELYQVRNGVRMISSRHGELFSFEKPAGTYRIVVFGGSTTENLNAFRTAGNHYPAILQERLREALGRSNIEVINVANSAYATPHSLVLLALDAISWQPDLIMVSHNINDLLVAYWPNFALDYSNKYKNKYYIMPDLENLYTPINIIFQESQLYWIVRDRFGRLLQKGPDKLPRKSYGMSPPPKALETFKRNLRSIIAIAKSNGIDVVVGTQPLFDEEAYFVSHYQEKPYNDIVVYPLHEEFVSHHGIYNDAIVQVALESGVYYLDNRANMSGNKNYFIDFIHYTPEGALRLAENYAEFLLANRSEIFGQ